MSAVLLALLLQAPPPTTPVEPARATLPFVYHERLAFVRANVNGSERTFLLDTGANASTLEVAVADELGLARGVPTTVEGTAGTLTVASTRATLAAGGLAGRELAVTVQDLSGLLRPPETRVDGILGADFLAAYVVRLDFVAREWTLDTAAFEPDAATLALELDRGIPRFQAQLDDLALPLRIDTGASLFESPDVYVNVPTPVWVELLRLDPTLTFQGQLAGTGAGGTVELPLARLSALVVGSTALARPWVIVQPPQGYFARPDAVGFVGNNFLEKFEVVMLDFPGRHLQLGARDER
jgi:hypothetical protein